MIESNIKRYMFENNLTMQELAEMADIPLETLRNIYYGRVHDPKVSTVYQLSSVLGVSVNALLGDERLEDEEKRLLQLYRECGSHGKSLISLVARYEHDAAVREKNAEGVHKVPCVVSPMSDWDGIPVGKIETVEITTDNCLAYLAVEISTNGFIPIFFKKDRVLLENRFPENGERAFFEIDDRLFFRQYTETEDEIRLKALNGRGRDIIAQFAEDIICIGTCIGVIRS